MIACQGGAGTLDPMIRNETKAMTWQRHTFFGNLTVFDCEGNVWAWLATGRHLDHTTRRSSVPQGVTIHDGSAVAVADVAFSSMRAPMQPRSAMRVAVGGIAIANLASVGPYTIVNSLAEDTSTGRPNPAAVTTRRRSAGAARGDPQRCRPCRSAAAGRDRHRRHRAAAGLPRFENATEAYATQAPELRLTYRTRDLLRDDTPGTREPNPIPDAQLSLPISLMALGA